MKNQHAVTLKRLLEHVDCCSIGYLPQEASVFRKLTAEENVLAILETRGLTAAEQRAQARELLLELGIQGMARQPAYTLSGGERRRLEICRRGPMRACSGALSSSKSSWSTSKW